jgi:hypothetical protein
VTKQYWQVAAGSEGRDYTNRFLQFGMAFVGGDAQIATMQQVTLGDVVLLKRGLSSIVAAGEVVERNGTHQGNGDKDWRLDLDGWELSAYCYVNWHVPAQPVSTDGLTRNSIQRVQQDKHRALADQVLSLPTRSADPEPGKSRNISDEDILRFLIVQGLRPSAADELTTTFRRIRRLADYYCQHSNGWKEIREHETRTFLVVPLLLALGWAEQQIKIEYPCSGGRVDIACFPRPYAGDGTECSVLIETKDFATGLDFAPDQARPYAESFPNCRVLVVTNGWCYTAFVRDAGSPTFRATPSAYMNILQPRDRYPLDPQHVAGALEVLQQLLPSYLSPSTK